VPSTSSSVPEDVFAHLHRAVLSARCDAAIGTLTGNRFLLKEAFGLGRVDESRVLEFGLEVRKSGRTTGVTTGYVTSVDNEVEVDGYPGTRVFEDQLTIENYGEVVADDGDSGSVWVDTENRAVGLHFAGDEAGALALANQFIYVLEDLDIGLKVGLTQQDLIAIVHNALA
jgi:hypothetical protein